MGILLAIHVLVTVFLILIVLVQKNEGGSSLFANSGGQGMFNARGTSNFLTKTTWVLASIFLVNCILMATLNSHKLKDSQTITDKLAEGSKAPHPGEDQRTSYSNDSEQSQTAESAEQIETQEGSSEEIEVQQ